MRSRLVGLGIGLVFGVVLSWSGMSSPVVIRQALLFQSAYLFLFFASAVLVASVGLFLLRRRRTRALLTEQLISWPRESVGRGHIVGSIIFGSAGAFPTPARVRSPPRSGRASPGASGPCSE
jgi:hypothetical protein